MKNNFLVLIILVVLFSLSFLLSYMTTSGFATGTVTDNAISGHQIEQMRASINNPAPLPVETPGEALPPENPTNKENILITPEENVEDKEPNNQTPNTVTGYVKRAAYTHIEPKGLSAVVSTLKKGDSVQIVGEISTWYKLSNNSYVSKNYVSLKK